MAALFIFHSQRDLNSVLVEAKETADHVSVSLKKSLVLEWNIHFRISENEFG